MSANPILFNTDMVCAILANRKTVTRRVVEPQLPGNVIKICEVDPLGYMALQTSDQLLGGWQNRKCRYAPGDILYVRETWTTLVGRYLYKADQKPDMQNPGKWRPSIHMPREAARIFLRVTDVRVERLRDIDYEGCKAEGIWDDYKTTGERYHDALARKAYPIAFAGLWDSTIKPADRALYDWAANPWVWVIKFERVSREEAMNNA